MKRSHLARLQDSDVFSVPKSLGLKALRQSSIMCVGMEMSGLHPLCLLYVQNTTGTEMIAFTDWASRLLSENGKYPVRSYWNAKTKDLENSLKVPRDLNQVPSLPTYSDP